MAARDLSAHALALLRGGRDDWISLAEAASLSGIRATPPSADVFRDALMTLAEELLRSGAARLGSVVRGDGFVPWELDEAGSIDALRALLDDDGDDWGYAAWFCNTELGDAIAEDASGATLP